VGIENTAKSILILGLILHLGGCGADSLAPTRRAPLQTDEPRMVEPPPVPPVLTGNIHGRVCNEDLGLWLGGIVAAIDTLDGALTDTTDGSGRFALDGVLVGDYVVHLSGPGYVAELPAVVVADQTTVVGANSCIGPLGTIRGRVCNQTIGAWAMGARVTLDDVDETFTFTDADGRFELRNVLAGNYEIAFEAPGYVGGDSATVFGNQVTEVGAIACEPLPPVTGGVEGRICAGNNYWVSSAAVVITSAAGTSAETLTNGDGYFSFDDLAPGTHSVDVTRGSFEMSFEVEIPAGGVNTMAEPVCFPPTTRIAVVTGTYDSVETVLDHLGFPVRVSHGAVSPVPLDADGNVDLIHGHPASNDYRDWPDDNASKYWIRTFLANAAWMAEYDIIFFACGFNEAHLDANNTAVITPALANLRTFVADGGSVYASDWAAELVRLAFPGHINFHGNGFGDSRLGEPNPALATVAIDSGLVLSLNDRTDLSFNFDLDYWVVMESAQPPSLSVLVDGDVVRFTDFQQTNTTTVHDAPVVAHFDYGDGRVLFTSAHTESQTTADLEDVLNYVIFEL